MQSIVWLASYPKSGNTWVRAFLANYLADSATPVPLNDLNRYCLGDMASWPYEQLIGPRAATASFEDIYALRPKAHRLLAQSRPGTVLVKTHTTLGAVGGVPTITPDVTMGAIYVVRNPLDVIVSYAAHYGIDLDAAIECSVRPDHAILRKPGLIDQLVGTWSGHVRSWTTAEGLNAMVVRYEDMLSDPLQSMRDLVTFCGLPANRPRLKRAIKFSSFDALRRQERKDGFVERSASGEAFFRTGRQGGGKKALSAEQIQRLIDAHGPVMEAHGYLEPAQAASGARGAGRAS